MPRAFGVTAVLGWRSTSSEGIPCRESSSEAVNPTGPPPEIRTGVSSIFFLSRFCLDIARA
jgi:hypothetical protein